MKKLFLVLLVALIAGIAFASGAQEATTTENGDKVPFIGISIFDYSNAFVGYIRNGINYYMAEKYPNVEYLMVDGENNQATQTEKIDTMISKGVDVLAVNPVDTTACDVIVAKAKEANLPVVFFNRRPSDEVLASYDKCYYVGNNTILQGQLQAEMLIDAWTNDQAKWDTNGDGVLQYVLLTGTPGHSDATDRINGFYEVLNKSDIKVEELANQPANWNSAKAVEVMDSWIGKFGDKIEMVISGNDAMALGAVESMKAHGLITADKIVPVIGVNALPEVSELIKEGIMLGSVLTSTYDPARAIIDICVNVCNGREADAGMEWKMVDRDMRIPEEKITKENVDIAIEGYKLAK